MTNELLPMWLAADVVVYATPLYNYGPASRLKKFHERTLPSLQPYFAHKDERTYHPVAAPNPAVVVLSVSGMPDLKHFEPLSVFMKYLFSSPGRRLIAEIYRPSAEMLTQPQSAADAEAILAAVKSAGLEIVNNQAVSPDTLAEITRPLVDNEAFTAVGNLWWRTLVQAGMYPSEFREAGRVLKPDSLETFLYFLHMGFNPEASAGLSARVQHNFSGKVEGECHYLINDGSIQTGQGPLSDPDLVVSGPFEVWADIVGGVKDGGQAFLNGEYTAEGDLDLLVRLGEIFGPR
jgi:hypothetical protein